MFELCDGERSVAQLAELVSVRLGEPEDAAGVQEVLDQLGTVGLLEAGHAGANGL